MEVQVELEKSIPQITQTFRLHTLVPSYYATATGKQNKTKNNHTVKIF